MQRKVNSVTNVTSAKSTDRLGKKMKKRGNDRMRRPLPPSVKVVINSREFKKRQLGCLDDAHRLVFSPSVQIED